MRGIKIRSVAAGPSEDGETDARSRRLYRDGAPTLAADECGADEGHPVLMFHGGGQTRHAWAQAGRRLAEDGWWVWSLDLRGHGDSEWPDDADYSLSAFAEDVADLARHFDRPPVLVGASLGGQAVLTAVGESKERLASAIVLVDIATRMEREGFDRIAGFLRAHRNGFATLEEAADAIAAYRGKPRARDLSGLRKNLRIGPEGRLHWHWDPRFLDTKEDRTTSETRLENAARAIAVPTLLVRGAQSDLLSPEGARHFLELAPHARFVDVSEAGHMVAGDRNDVFTEAVRRFLLEERERRGFGHASDGTPEGVRPRSPSDLRRSAPPPAATRSPRR